jgi:hypothetical protein
MKLYHFYNGIEEIVNAAVKATEVEIDHLFFVPEKESNINGWCDAHRYGYNSKTGECYDLGLTDVMPKIDYAEFVFDFIPNGIHIAKRDRTTFKVNGSLYLDTEIN